MQNVTYCTSIQEDRMEEKNQQSSGKLSQKIDLLLESYIKLKEELNRLKTEINEKNKIIQELEDRFLEKELEEEDIISKIESALNNNGI